MLIRTVRVSDKGQIAIPKDIRDAAGIERGDELVVVHDAGKLLFQKAEGLSKRIDDDFKDMRTLSEASLKKIWDNEVDDVWNEAGRNRHPPVPVQRSRGKQAKAGARRQ